MLEVQSVSEVVHQIKQLLEGEFLNLTIEGELTNISRSSAGHVYFNISDASASISCALFKMDALRNPIIRKIKDGDKVILRGPISVYQKRGTFQLIVKKITPIGKGDLKAEFEKLKAQLAAQGYFDIEHKKEIPKLPKKVVVITALRGAALQDFLNVMKRRSLWYEITIIPATVQGDQCPGSVIKAIAKAERLDKVDVIVITRGGGSLEDLWGFNDRRVVQKAYDCEIPIISAIGHQVDYSLLDFVSDLRCETPSTAAETLSQEHTHLIKKMTHVGKSLKMHMIEVKSSIEKKLYKLNPTNATKHLNRNLVKYQMRLDELKFEKDADVIGINEYHQRLDDMLESICREMQRRIEKSKSKLTHSYALLSSLNPDNVLAIGYSILSTNDGKVLTSHKDFAKMNENAELSIKFSDGSGKVIKKSE